MSPDGNECHSETLEVDFGKGLATGFVFGVALIGGAVVLLNGHDDATHELNSARIQALEKHVERLELTLTKLSREVETERQIAAIPAALPVSVSKPGGD
jgi:hypothetical protein